MSVLEEVGRLIAPSLQLKLFICLSSPVATPQAILPHLPEHLRYLMHLEKKGVLVASGPFVEGGQIGLRALMVIRADDMQEARNIFSEEPLHKRALRTFSVEEWQLNQGRINVRLDFSDQTGALS